MDTVENIRFNIKNVMLNLVHDNPTHITNLLLLISKQYMYYCKCIGKIFSCKELLIRIESMYQIELYNYSKDHKRRKHLLKWSPYDKERIDKTCKNTDT